MPKTDDRLLTFAKRLRQDMTPAEARLWYRLRAKRLGGMKFVRQSVRRPFIADFVARSAGLVIEVDGDTHATAMAYDARRTGMLEAQGYRVLRFTNHDVMTNEDGVIATILEALSPSPPLGEATHSPKGGEGQATNAAPAPLPPAGYAGSFPLPERGRGDRPTPSPPRGEGRGEGQATNAASPLPSAGCAGSLPLPGGEREK